MYLQHEDASGYALQVMKVREGPFVLCSLPGQTQAFDSSVFSDPTLCWLVGFVVLLIAQ